MDSTVVFHLVLKQLFRRSLDAAAASFHRGDRAAARSETDKRQSPPVVM